MNRRPSTKIRRLKRQEIRAEILEAAAAAIAEHGYHGMTMRGLARATSMALANYYNYFSSKEDLLFALQNNAFQTLISTAKEALKETNTPAEGLYVLIFNHIRYVAGHQAAMRVLVHEASALPPARRKTIRILKERYFQIGRELVAAILADSCGHPDTKGNKNPQKSEIEPATYSIFGMLNWSYGWYEPKRHGPPQDVAATIHRIALCGLVAQCPHRPIQEIVRPHLDAADPPPLIGGAKDRI
jgi:AcrR family transcriptional regulator